MNQTSGGFLYQHRTSSHIKLYARMFEPLGETCSCNLLSLVIVTSNLSTMREDDMFRPFQAFRIDTASLLIPWPYGHLQTLERDMENWCRCFESKLIHPKRLATEIHNIFAFGFRLSVLHGFPSRTFYSPAEAGDGIECTPGSKSGSCTSRQAALHDHPQGRFLFSSSRMGVCVLEHTAEKAYVCIPPSSVPSAEVSSMLLKGVIF